MTNRRDRTRAIAESFAGVRVISPEPLPAGWTGKNNALVAGVKEVRGEWLAVYRCGHCASARIASAGTRGGKGESGGVVVIFAGADCGYVLGTRDFASCVRRTCAAVSAGEGERSSVADLGCEWAIHPCAPRAYGAVGGMRRLRIICSRMLLWLGLSRIQDAGFDFATRPMRFVLECTVASCNFVKAGRRTCLAVPAAGLAGCEAARGVGPGLGMFLMGYSFPVAVVECDCGCGLLFLGFRLRRANFTWTWNF